MPGRVRIGIGLELRRWWEMDWEFDIEGRIGIGR